MDRVGEGGRRGNPPVSSTHIFIGSTCHDKRKRERFRKRRRRRFRQKALPRLPRAARKEEKKEKREELSFEST
jgi:hypothetical protein